MSVRSRLIETNITTSRLNTGVHLYTFKCKMIRSLYSQRKTAHEGRAVLAPSIILHQPQDHIGTIPNPPWRWVPQRIIDFLLDHQKMYPLLICGENGCRTIYHIHLTWFSYNVTLPFIKNSPKCGTEEMVQSTKGLPHKHEDLSSDIQGSHWSMTKAMGLSFQGQVWR